MRPILLFAVICLVTVQMKSQCLVNQLLVDSYVYTTEFVAQAFEPCSTAPVEQIDFYVHNFLSGEMDAVFTIHEGTDINSPAIFSAEIVLDDEWGGLHTYEFTEELILEEQITYTLKVDFLGSHGAAWISLSNVYDEGQFQWGADTMEYMDLGFNVHMVAVDVECMLWKGTNGNSWFDPLNWDPQMVPDYSQCVTVPTTSTGNYPLIDDKAEALSVDVYQGAKITVTEEATLEVHQSLRVLGEGTFDGDVIMMNTAGDATLFGDLTINRLKINGVIFLIQPLTILDLLDLSDGYLMNFGHHLTVLESTEFKGHVYFPEFSLGGSIIVKKEFSQTGDQLIAAPVSNATIQSLIDSAGVAILEEFEEGPSIEEFHSNWTTNSTPGATHQVMEAYRIHASEGEFVAVAGDLSSEAQQVLGTSTMGSALGDWKLIANPYPSILDWTKVERSQGASSALYQWNEDAQQFSTNIHGISLHNGNTQIRPMEGFFVRLPVGEQMDIEYETAVVTPSELYEDPSTEEVYEPLLKLGVTTPSGSDRTIVSFHPLSSSEVDNDMDAFKIPSLNDDMPTLGSVSSDGYVLSVNRLTNEDDNGIIPLYFTPGMEGQVTFNADLIENFVSGEEIYLEDRKLDVFHNLFDDGVYVSTMDQTDVATRFFLHINWTPTNNSHPSVAVETELEVVDDENTDPIPAIHAVDDQVFIVPPFGHVLPASSSISIYSMNGRLVYSDTSTEEQEQLIARLHCSSGYYLVIFNDGAKETVEKVKIN